MYPEQNGRTILGETIQRLNIFQKYSDAYF